MRSALSPPRNHPLRVATGSVGADLPRCGAGGVPGKMMEHTELCRKQQMLQRCQQGCPGPSCLPPTAAPALTAPQPWLPRSDTRWVLLWRELQGIKGLWQRGISVWVTLMEFLLRQIREARFGPRRGHSFIAELLIARDASQVVLSLL